MSRLVPIFGPMGCLRARVSLRDIGNVDRWVSEAVRRLALDLRAWQREELELEGVTLLYELERDWDGRGTFSGYAASLLGLRLLTAWRKMCGYSRAAGADGRYRWTARMAGSLDELLDRPGFREQRVWPMRDFARIAA